MECFTSLCDSASIDTDELQSERHRCDKTAQTYPMLGEIYCRKASLADLLPPSELANYLIGFVFGVRRWWWAQWRRQLELVAQLVWRVVRA